MTTFQAIVFSIVQGFSEFLPVGAMAHRMSVSYLLGWPEPSGVFLGTLFLAGFLALLIYFIHDWASMVSSLLQVILFRRKPMTLDERLPFFLTLTTVPAALAWSYADLSFQEEFLSNPIWLAGSLAAFSIPLWFSDNLNRRIRSMFDWNWLDSLYVGIAQILSIVPGCGRTTAALGTGFFRNYHRDAAAKFGFFAAAPLLAQRASQDLGELDFSAAAPMPETTWFTLGVAFVVTLLASLLAIDSFMKQIQKKGPGGYVVYRWVIAAALCVVFWLRSRDIIS